MLHIRHENILKALALFSDDQEKELRVSRQEVEAQLRRDVESQDFLQFTREMNFALARKVIRKPGRSPELLAEIKKIRNCILLVMLPIYFRLRHFPCVRGIQLREYIGDNECTEEMFEGDVFEGMFRMHPG